MGRDSSRDLLRFEYTSEGFISSSELLSSSLNTISLDGKSRTIQSLFFFYVCYFFRGCVQS